LFRRFIGIQDFRLLQRKLAPSLRDSAAELGVAFPTLKRGANNRYAYGALAGLSFCDPHSHAILMAQRLWYCQNYPDYGLGSFPASVSLSQIEGIDFGFSLLPQPERRIPVNSRNLYS
jgi:hypothetical protein